MAWSVPDTFVGTTITWESSFVILILDVSWDDISREMIETTHATTSGAYRTYIPSDYSDAGSLNCTIEFAANTLPPFDQAFENCTVDWGGDGTTWAASAAISNFSVTGNTSGTPDMATATCTLKFSGLITLAGA